MEIVFALWLLQIIAVEYQNKNGNNWEQQNNNKGI